MATGHYARVDALEDADAAGGRRYRLLTGLDADKDQSYFLYGLRQDQLAHTRFPLGDLTKPEVRDVARRHGLVTAEKPESQEICFVPGGDYRDALQDDAPAGARQPGPLLDVDGAQVGEHRGAAAYTVGQRQGLGVALGEPRYVSSIDAATNVVTLGRREDLYRREFELERRVVRWPALRRPTSSTHARPHPPPRRRPFPATVHAQHRTSGRWSVTLERAAWAPAPGQAAVFYDGDEVVGGGRIAA